MKKVTSRILIGSAIGVLCLGAFPAALLISDFAIESPFASTYYGELSPMYDRLSKAKGKKIVFVGNSAVAFGIDSALIEEELGYEGESYTVCNFGLYGAIGTKTMLDLSLPQIKKGDIVVLMPEEYPQAMSTYLSTTENWRAIGGHPALEAAIPNDDRASYLAAFSTYVSEKLYWARQGEKPDSGEVYARDSFDDHCDMRFAEREENIMEGAYDKNNPIELTEELVSDDFLQMVNDYAAALQKKGASCYYAFAPMNQKGLANGNRGAAAFYKRLRENLRFPILHSPTTMIYAPNWFFDSNYHLNEAGMRFNTIQIIDALKNQLDLYGEIRAQTPIMPELPTASIIQGDDSDEGFFEYSLDEDAYIATALTAEGGMEEELIIPSMHEGLPVKSFAASLFQGNQMLQKVTVQENCRRLPDNAFSGSNIEGLYLTQTDPSKIGVGFHLLDGNPGIKIYVKRGCLSSFQLDYFWGHYSGRYAVY